MGSPSSVITLGLGSWGSPSLIITSGYGVGAAIASIGVILFTAESFTTPDAISESFTTPDAINESFVN